MNTIIGTKLTTVPTPPKMPTLTRERNAGDTPQRPNAPSHTPVSQFIPDSIHPCTGAPSTSIDSQMTREMTTAKIGRAVYFPVSTLSMLRLRRYSLLSRGLTTVRAQRRFMKVKRMSAMAAQRSRPRSSSIWRIMCSTISFSFSDRSSFAVTSASPSISLLAAKRMGRPARLAWSSTRCIMPWMQRWTAPP